MEIVEFFSIPAISALSFGIVEIIKKTYDTEGRLKKLYPIISAFIGVLVGISAFLAQPDLIIGDSLLSSVLVGMASGLSATGGNEIFRRIRKKEIELIDDSPTRFYITGDKHRCFDKLIEFCKTHHLRQKDVIIILGDSGFNYYGDQRDDKLKAKLAQVKVTLFCLHGNKENRAHNIPTYGVRSFCGGKVYYEPQYPNVFFAIDGEIYNFCGREFIVVGGAHSVDKYRCLQEELPYWYDEMPSCETKRIVEEKLSQMGNRIYGILTHTCPISYLPEEMFISTGRAQHERKNPRKAKKRKKKEYPLDIDRSTETWLESIKENNQFDIWYCGHYHVDKELDNIHMMFREILPLCSSDKYD